MGTFRVGQKVVCVDTEIFDADGDFVTDHPKKNEIVEIDAIDLDGYLSLVGYSEYRYDQINFRPIDESFGERICAEITEKVKSEELVYD